MLAKRPTCALARVIYMESTRAKAQNNCNLSGPILRRDMAPFYSAIDNGDMDVNAGRIQSEDATPDSVGDEICDKNFDLAKGSRTASEKLGHQEFVLTYKTFDPVGPACLPNSDLT